MACSRCGGGNKIKQPNAGQTLRPVPPPVNKPQITNTVIKSPIKTAIDGLRYVPK